MDSYKLLSKKRGSIRTSITKTINKLNEDIDGNSQNPEIEDSLALLIDKEIQLIEIDKEIEGLIDNETELDKEIDSCMKYREEIILCKSRVNRYIRNLSRSELSKQSVSLEVKNSEEGKIQSKGVHLPKLTISKFSGNICEWQNFWAHFESAIHENEGLKDVDKFNYLKSLLTDTALTAISGLPLTAENYKKATKILNDRFGNKELQISAHMNRLLNIEPVRRSNDLKALRNLYDNLEIEIRSLETLKVTSDSYGRLLCPILLQAIPSDLVLQYNRQHDSEKETSVSDILDYLRKEIESREKTFSNKISNTVKPYPNEVSKFNNPISNLKHKEYINRSERNSVPTAASLNVNTETKNCLFCKGSDHLTEKCLMNVTEKKNSLRKSGRCFKCLAKFHVAQKCGRKIKCSNCDKENHNTLLCWNESKSASTESEENKIKNLVVASVAEFRTESISSFLLQTVRAKITNNKTGRKQYARILLDLGSQRSFITNEVYERLNLPVVGEEELKIFGFGNSSPEAQGIKWVSLVLQSTENSNINVKIEALVTPVISEAYVQVPGNEITELCRKKGIQITDKLDQENKDATISLLLGADFYWSVVKNRVKRLSNLLVAVDTKFGWVISGSENMFATKSASINSMKVVVADAKETEEASISNLVKNFWELESLGVTHHESDYDSELGNDMILDDFRKSVEFKDGRYTVHFPWNHNIEELGDNLEVAKNRFKALIRKFKNDPNFYERYKNVIDQYLIEGIAEESDCKIGEKTYFMPHQAVIREDKDTTKLRVVFDASSHAKNCLSLNDCLDVGPNLYPEILELILRFRQSRIAFTADIQQAFLQISLAEEDRNAVKFLWNDDLETNQLKVLRMTRVIFGAKSSPFLLGATLKIHIETYEEQYPEEVSLLKESLYVDDLVSGTDEEDEVFRLCTNIKDIMKQGGFNMRKLKTNEERIQKIWNDDNDVIEDSSYCKVLGYLWNKSDDTFLLDVKSVVKDVENLNNEVTKREVLKIIGRLYDPVGFLTPFTIRARILLQEIWDRGLLWDAVLPKELSKQWENWCNEIHLIPNIEIPRHQFEGLRRSILKNTVQLHCFCDASQKAYGAVLYFRYDIVGRIFTSFVTSKSRVAPLKKLSLPRLELMGALIGSRLVKYVEKTLHDMKLVTHFWTDSNITLHWIQSEPKKWKPFVKNRVVEIQKNTLTETWRHCPGSENPADLLSRGVKLESIGKNSLWWTGPKWLKESEENWPVLGDTSGNQIEEQELRKSYKETSTNACITQSTEALFDTQKYNNPNKIYRVTAWCLRYVNNLRNSSKLSGALTTEEVESAERYWIKHVQSSNFLEEIRLLQKGQQLPPESKIRTLNPFLDDNGILRVAGLCRTIFSDNAQTFKTAKREIDLLFQTMKGTHVQDYFSQKSIKWKFIIEKAAWWGGFWERMVRSLKSCLRRILGRSCLTFRELETVLLEVEAILNSRPLTFVYSDQQEPEPLTPGHFLIGRRLLALPPCHSVIKNTSATCLRQRMKHQEIMTQRLWKVWKHTYLMGLRSAHHDKMVNKGSNLQEGELVLIHEDKMPRLMWKMGRISKVFRGRDRKVRACSVRLPNGNDVRRPVQLLFPLELSLGKDSRLSGPEDVLAPLHSAPLEGAARGKEDRAN